MFLPYLEINPLRLPTNHYENAKLQTLIAPLVNEAPVSVYFKEHRNYIYNQKSNSLHSPPKNPMVYSTWNLFVEPVSDTTNAFSIFGLNITNA